MLRNILSKCVKICVLFRNNKQDINSGILQNNNVYMWNTRDFCGDIDNWIPISHLRPWSALSSPFSTLCLRNIRAKLDWLRVYCKYLVWSLRWMYLKHILKAIQFGYNTPHPPPTHHHHHQIEPPFANSARILALSWHSVSRMSCDIQHFLHIMML